MGSEFGDFVINRCGLIFWILVGVRSGTLEGVKLGIDVILFIFRKIMWLLYGELVR